MSNVRETLGATAAAAALWLAMIATVQAAVHTVQTGESIQEAVNRAVAGDSVHVMPGIYEQTVYIDKDDIRLRGIIVNGQRPILDGKQQALHDGIIASGHGVVIEGFHVRNYRSNGITTQGGNNFVIRNNIVDNIHLYGIFPQFGKNGLVANNIISRTSDAGIYVGMSENVDVIANEVYDNALGIEAENSHFILIEANYVHDNAVGIPVVIIPGLQTKTSADTIVRNNFVINNNAQQFERARDRSGRGITVVGADRVIIEGNIVKGNRVCGVCVASVGSTGTAFPVDAAIDPQPDQARIVGNVFVNNGYETGDFQVFGAPIPEGADIMNFARGNDHCFDGDQGATLLGVNHWQDCEGTPTSTKVRSYQLDEPIPSEPLSPKQKAQLTYHAVCSGCHAYSHIMIGPPMQVIQGIYRGKPEALASWIAAPEKKWPADRFPAMPPQNYLSEELRLDLARYILNEVGN
ncbi:conserved hypothetical protein [Luminiphilus syltensis NOR5-1B]|uniref:Cytochrome c domain-containing protein n=1 Tax=Luminiphilus syltensis NOR5-1B TaxID=565045 RepID=B8KY01_9GAMM|nr:NosD domain-containing protein [Luminiphilus syltensis]EED35886.1 conserved hypothetical protein [Luminiphilus syltensis NOR5-1B]